MSSPFDMYRVRLGFDGQSQREARRGQSQRAKGILFEDSQSFKTVYVNGIPYDARIIQDVAATVKQGSGNYQIEFRDGDLFRPGTYVEFENSYGDMEVWLMMDSSDDLLFPLHPIKKCVRQLHWKNEQGKIIDRWMAFDDTYKLYDGVRSYDNFTTLPDSTITIFLPYDQDTIKLRFDARFLIDAEGLDEPEAWRVVNRNAVSRVQHGDGVIMLTLGRDQFNHETDDPTTMVADYYSEVKQPELQKPLLNVDSAVFTYKGQPKIVAGTPAKSFGMEFYDKNGTKLDGLIPQYELLVLPELEQFFTSKIEGGKISVAVKYNENVINYKFKIRGFCDEFSQELTVKVVSGV